MIVCVCVCVYICVHGCVCVCVVCGVQWLLLRADAGVLVCGGVQADECGVVPQSSPLLDIYVTTRE